MDKPLISFILPVFNNNNSILPTIQSLIAQKYSKKEIIIIDDSSTDNSINLIQKYIKKYPYIKLITEPAIGKIHNLKSGLAKSKGSFIMFVETGKIYIDTMSDYLISNLQSSTNIISSDFFCISESEYYNYLEIFKKSPIEKFINYSGKKFFQKLSSSSDHTFENCISLWNKFIKKSLLKQIDFDKYTNTYLLSQSIISLSQEIIVSNQLLICKIFIDNYYFENCFNYKNLETILFLENLIIEFKKGNNQKQIYNCSLRLMTFLLKIRKQLAFYALDIPDKTQLRKDIDKKFNSIYKFLHTQYNSYAKEYEHINEEYRKIIKDEKFRSKYYFLYPPYVENYPN